MKATRSFRLFCVANNKAFRRVLASASTARTAYPAAIHTADPQGIDAEEEEEAAIIVPKKELKPSKEYEPLVPPKIPFAASPQLESIGVNQSLDPTTQQKRNTSTTAAAPENVSCVGSDGRPLQRDNDEEWQMQEDDFEYYKHHKASPLSHISVVDTRKPITQATDGTAGDFKGDTVVIGWRPEQLDTAEEALRRACEIWKQMAMRGVPDYPHSRFLRALRGEEW